MRVKDGEIVEDASDIAVLAPETRPAPRPEATEAEAGSETAQPETVAMQGLPALTLKSGRVLIGEIIHATGSIVTVRMHGTGVVPTSRAQIERVQFVGDDGIVEGEFVDWSDQIYRLKDGDREILASLSESSAAAGLPEILEAHLATRAEAAASEAAEEALIDYADAALAPDTDSVENAEGTAAAAPVAELEPEASEPGLADAAPSSGDDAELHDAPGAGGPVSETAVAGLADTAGSLSTSRVEAAVPPEKAAGDAPHLVEARVKEVSEDGQEVVFEFHLAPAAARPLVILYAATDDTAVAGQDFEAKSGVITFSKGSEYAEVRVSVIDDQQSEASEHFHLFLSGDPETIQFSQRQIQATINDDD
jgi:hypothetical protein